MLSNGWERLRRWNGQEFGYDSLMNEKVLAVLVHFWEGKRRLQIFSQQDEPTLRLSPSHHGGRRLLSLMARVLLLQILC
jgi:hypothetical protein